MSGAPPTTLAAAGEALARGATTSTALTQAILDRIAAHDGSLHSYLAVTAEDALAQAAAADARLAGGDRLTPLTGIPIALKDNICWPGAPTTCGSRILETFVPPYAATVVERLLAAGAVIVGKTNLDEFAMGSSTENSAYGPTRNPWDPDRVPGGSSGGSAAAMAAGFCYGALGSDTGGSIRQPAALCGITGFKPTYGTVSRYGLVAFASSLDQIGPLTRTAEDAAILMSVLAGHDPLDSTSAPRPADDFPGALGNGIRGLRIGLPDEVFERGTNLAPGVRESVEQAVDVLCRNGASTVRVSLKSFDSALAAYYIIAPSEASSNLARYDGARYGLRVEGRDAADMFARTRAAGFGPEVKRRIMIGTYALSAGYYDAYYLKAQKVRTLIKRDFDEAFKACDIIAMPATPNVAFRLGEKTEDPLEMYMADIFTVPMNLAGLPALVVPCRPFVSASPKYPELPIGLQLIAPAFGDAGLLAVGHHFQQLTDFHTRRPVLN